MSSSDYDSSIPRPELTEAGFVAPSEQDILSGALADINAALGGQANLALNTPQGQLAVSLTAILGDVYAAMLGVFNGMDPAANSGRMQEAIGRIYFLTRRPATATIVGAQLTTTGGGQTIAAGTSVAIDRNGNIYAPSSDIVLPSAPGQVNTPLTCQTLGAIICPVGALTLYQAGLGITSLTNNEVGLTGLEAESRAEFETRREQSVSANSIGQNAAILGAILSQSDVEDAFVVDNPAGHESEVKGVTLAPYSLYVVVQGGTDENIARAIIAHKSPGCAMQGSVSVQVKDENIAYHGNNPVYTVNFDRIQAVTLYISVKLARPSILVPQDAPERAIKALMNHLTSSETRPRIGATLYASRLATVVNALGDWAEVLDLSLGTNADVGKSSLTLPINQVLAPDASEIAVTIEG